VASPSAPPDGREEHDRGQGRRERGDREQWAQREAPAGGAAAGGGEQLAFEVVHEVGHWPSSRERRPARPQETRLPTTDSDELRVTRPAGEVREQDLDVAAVEDRERLGLRARGGEQVVVGAFVHLLRS
jgi:hypothetical protein